MNPSTPPPASGTTTRQLGSLAAVVAALVTCKHPPEAHLGANVLVISEPMRFTWCSLCGALSSDRQVARWEHPALSALLSADLLSTLSAVLHAVRQCGDQPEQGGDATLDPALARELARLSHSRLVADAHRLDDALAEKPGFSDL